MYVASVLRGHILFTTTCDALVWVVWFVYTRGAHDVFDALQVEVEDFLLM